MDTFTRVALDAMGGDNAPECNVLGAVDAVRDNDRLKVFLVGQKDKIDAVLEGKEYDKDRIEVVDAPEVIENAEPPVLAIRK